VAKVRELLATTGELLSLSQIANAIGASPAHLADLFHRIEGMPIYRYQIRLRLARACSRSTASGGGLNWSAQHSNLSAKMEW
jgi:AraC-like DNA-binding protein